MSYEDFFGFKLEPFALEPDPKFYFNSPQHSVAREYILHATSRGRGMALLMGYIGTGKTTLSRRIIFELEENDEYEVGTIVLTHPPSAKALLQKIAYIVGVEDIKGEPDKLFSMTAALLEERFSEGKKTLVFIDESNKLSDPEAIEELRGFLNLETADGKKLITFVLIGLPDLDEHLRNNSALYQRIAVRIILKPLDKASTEAYIKHRLKIAGVFDEIFTQNAIEYVYEYSGGRPRLINILCDNALLEAYLQRKHTIDEFIITKVAELQGLSRKSEINT